MTDGLLYAWSSPFIVKIANDKEHYDISETEASYFAIIPSIACMITSTPFAKLCDVIGRKKTLLLIVIPHLTAWILKAVARSVYVFYIARFFVGISFACIYAVLPMYVGEVVAPEIRGSLSSLISSCYYLGSFFINVIGNMCDVKTTSYICAPLEIVFFALFIFMPESPYYLIMKNKDDEAKNALRRLLRKSNIETDFSLLKNDIHRQMTERGTWKDLFTISSNKKALIIGTFLRVSQHLGGVFVFFTSTQFIFQKAGGTIKADTATIIFAFLLFIFYFAAGVLVDTIGRRPAFITSMALSSIILLLEAIYFYIQAHHPEINMESVENWFPLVIMIIYIIFSSFGPGIIPTLMIGEIFSTSIKSKAITLMLFIFSFMIFSITQIFYLLNSYAGLFAPFLLFGFSNLITGILGYFYLPETKGKSLEEIQQELKGNRSGQRERKLDA